MSEQMKKEWEVVEEIYRCWHSGYECFAVDALNNYTATLKAQCDELLEFANAVVRWSEAYPDCIFVEPTPEQVDEVCKNLGCRIDNISAMILRQFTKPWGDKARAVIANAEKDKSGC